MHIGACNSICLLLLANLCTTAISAREPFFSQTLYEQLLVTSNCNTSAIKQNYRRQALKMHPDKNPGIDPRFFLAISKAHTVLINPKAREAYDQKLARGEASTQSNDNYHQDDMGVDYNDNNYHHDDRGFDYNDSEYHPGEPQHLQRNLARRITELSMALYVLYLAIQLFVPAALQPMQSYYCLCFSRTWISADGSIRRKEGTQRKPSRWT
jgi:hypothetical protein